MKPHHGYLIRFTVPRVILSWYPNQIGEQLNIPMTAVTLLHKLVYLVWQDGLVEHGIYGYLRLLIPISYQPA